MLAVAGLLIMIAMLVGAAMANRPKYADLVSRTLMKGATLRSRLAVGFRLLAIVPMLTVLPLLAVISSISVRDSQMPQVERLASSIAESVPQLIESRVAGLESLAGHISAAGSSSPTDLSESLLRHHHSSREFSSLLIVRRDGDVVAASAIKSERVTPWAGPAAGVSMMNSFKRAVKDGGVYIAPVKKGAAAEKSSMMFVSVPISLNGIPNWGFVQGLLNVNKVTGALVSQGSTDSVAAIITDENNRVILMSPGLAMPLFGEISGHPLMAAAAKVSPGSDFAFTGIVNNDGAKTKYIAVNQPMSNGWQVYATATQSSADMIMLVFFALGLIWAFFALLLARRLAPLYGEVVAEPLQQLEESLEIFDAARTVTIMSPAAEDAPHEIRRAFARVRESMQSSRQAYRNMMKVVNEGNELRQKLLKVSAGSGHETTVPGADGSDDPGINDQTIVADHIAREPDLETQTIQSGAPTSGKADEVTGLATLPVFEGFFGEAWALSMTDSQPIVVLIVRTSETGDEQLIQIGERLSKTAGRTLDLVARIADWDFGLILPDMDLEGGIAIAEKLIDALQDLGLHFSIGVSSIIPNEKGNAKSFLEICRRAATAASEEGAGKIAFVSNEGKLMLHQPVVEEEKPASEDDPSPEDDPYLIEWEVNA